VRFQILGGGGRNPGSVDAICAMDIEDLCILVFPS
jgi:hypothetical protein